MNEDIRRCIETIKSLGLDMIEAAKSGHPGIVLGAAPIMYNLFANHIKIKPEDDTWANRDRFVMSAGHGSALLYSTLFLAGYNIELNELKNFRKINSILPGHPEYKQTPGVEITTGPLGQGFASAVGMALAQRYLAATLEAEYQKQNIINHNIYVLCGDGDLMEGISYEAASFAGTQKLGQLIVLYDSNNITLDGKTSQSFTENVLARFNALGWHTEFVKDAEDFKSMDKAINKAKKDPRPSIIEIKTIIGKGSIVAGTNIAHGKPFDPEDLENVRRGFLVRDVPFTVSKDATVFFRNKINSRCNSIYSEWTKNASEMYGRGNEIVKKTFDLITKNEFSIDFDPTKLQINPNYLDELRNSNNQIMNIIADRTPFFIGGSADLSSSCKTNLNKYEEMNAITKTGRNIFFGVREHAMGAILNGMSTYGLRVFGSTFLTFSDYLKPAIRLSALMDVPVTYIFTHDSVSIGEDGATHQPVEQLAALRSIPNINVYRPADINEIIGCWSEIIKSTKPSILVISKQKIGLVDKTDATQVSKGAYIVRKELQKLDGIIIASGTEVNTAINIATQLYQTGLDIRVISMPCEKTFVKQGINYREALLPIGSKIITLEASNDPTWYKYTYNNKMVLKIDDFGYSAKGEDVLKVFEFDEESLKLQIEQLLK